MGKNIEHIQHLRSNEVVNGQPKAPTANNLLDGEIAVNYAAGNETLFIKSGDGSNVKSFSNDDNFYKKDAIDDIVSGINDTISGLSGDTQSEIEALDEKKFDASGITGYTTTAATKALNDVVTAHTGDATVHFTTGAVQTQIDDSISGKCDTSAFTAHTSSTVHMNATEKTHLDSLAANIGVISGITAQKVTNWDNASTNSHTHSNKTALDSITGNVGTMAYADASNYSSATQVNTALAGKSNTGHTHSSNEVVNMSGYTKPTSTSAIVTGDTLNAAIGKLEKAIDGRQPVGSYVETSTYTSYTSTTQSTINSKANSSTTVSSAEYYVSGTTHQLRFKDVAGNVISTVDAGEFIKDGMIDTVEIQTVPYSGELQPCLVITWNTDAGKDVTYIPIKNIFNPNDYVPTGRTITTASGLTGGGNLGSNRTIGLEATGTAGTYYVANTDAYGRVTGGTTTVPYSSATQVNTALARKSDTGHTHDNIYYRKSELTGGTSAVTVSKAEEATYANQSHLNSDATTNKDYSLIWGQNTLGTSSTSKLKHSSTDLTYNPSTKTLHAEIFSGTSTDCSKLNGLTIMKITRAAYNALATKDPNTLYVISD